MPELPEVETIRKGLEPVIYGSRIQSIDVHDTRLRWPVDVDALDSLVQGEMIVAVNRRSKYLIWQLSNDAHVVIHLGMSGRLGAFRPDEPLEKHTHLVFHLDDVEVRYRDPRRFGMVEVVEPGGLQSYVRFAHLGPEPLSDQFNADYIAKALRGKKFLIKTAIMDARLVVGVGNIYANEALFGAGIHPQRPAGSLSGDEAERLVKSIKDVLTDALHRGGTTLNDYRNALGETGFFQQYLYVYQRDGEPCLNCGNPVEKVVLTGRSTFFCPECQG